MGKLSKLKHCPVLYYLLIFLHTNITANNYYVGASSEHQERQLQIISLFKNVNCKQNGYEFVEIKSEFTPLDHLHLYSNPNAISDFVRNLLQLKRKPGREGFHSDPQSVLQVTTSVFDILYFIDTSTPEGWDLFLKTARYISSQVDPSVYVSGLKAILDTKYYGIFKSPPYYEIFPQLYVPKWDILDMNSSVKENKHDRLDYYRSDATLNDFHTAWHIHYPTWWNGIKYNLYKDRKGEEFLYAHHQIMNRYLAEQWSNKVGPLEALKVDGSVPITEGYIPNVLHINLTEFPSRPSNSFMDNQTAIDLKTFETRILDSISQGFFVSASGMNIAIRGDDADNINSTEILGGLIEASRDSINPTLYGNLHNRLHNALSQITGEGQNATTTSMGVIGFAETAMHDPVFYQLHLYVDNILRKHKNMMEPYTSKAVRFPGIDLLSISIVSQNSSATIPSKVMEFLRKIGLTFRHSKTPILSTFFKSFTFDISNGIQNCSSPISSDQPFTVKMQRLSHHPFEYIITAFSTKLWTVKAMVRIFMAPTEDWEGKKVSMEDLYWNMIEMDKFPVVIKPGTNIIRRPSKNSSVTIEDQLGFRELIQETEKTPETSGRPFQPCGFPNHLLLPKGTIDGMKFKMFVIITNINANEFYDESQYPSVSLCGVGRGAYPDSKPLGFPFDKKIDISWNRFPLPFIGTDNNYRFLDVLVKHNGNQ